MAFKLCTININGFRQTYKQISLFSKLQEIDPDVLFIQECYITNWKEARVATKFWQGKSFWSFGGNRSRGVGILIAKDLEYQLVKQYHDTNGRLVYVDINMNGNQFRFMNIYAPNNPKERKDFLESIANHLVSARDINFGWRF